MDGGDAAAVAAAAREGPGVRTAVVTTPGRGGEQVVEVIPDVETADSRSTEVVQAVRDASDDLPGVVGVAGTGSVIEDYSSAVLAMTFWLPVLVFAFLFGLSMDYEVFILARMREAYDAGSTTAESVVEGLGRTGRLVTSAVLILFFAFAALASVPSTDLKVFATALGVGILLDATVVRALLVPALVSLFGRWNWWLPAGVARVLRVEPSPLEPRRQDDGPRPHGEPERERVPV